MRTQYHSNIKMNRRSVMVMPGRVTLFKVELIETETRKYVLRNPVTGDMLTAHDNCKHVYWSSFDEAWIWGHFTFDEHKRLVSVHDTCMWYDTDTERMWQYHQHHEDMDGSLYLFDAHKEMDDSDDSPPEILNSEMEKMEQDQLENDAFKSFCKKQRPGIKANHPGSSQSEHQNILADIWNGFDDDAKTEYFI